MRHDLRDSCGALLCGFNFLLFTAADIEEFSDVRLPSIDSFAGALDDLKIYGVG